MKRISIKVRAEARGLCDKTVLFNLGDDQEVVLAEITFADPNMAVDVYCKTFTLILIEESE